MYIHIYIYLYLMDLYNFSSFQPLTSNREVFLNFLPKGNVGKSTVPWIIKGIHLCSHQSRSRNRTLSGHRNPLQAPLPKTASCLLPGLFIYLFITLWPHLWHMDLPRPGIESKLQLQSMVPLWPHRILITHCAGPGIESIRLQRPEPLQSDS